MLYKPKNNGNDQRIVIESNRMCVFVKIIKCIIKKGQTTHHLFRMRRNEYYHTKHLLICHLIIILIIIGLSTPEIQISSVTIKNG